MEWKFGMALMCRSMDHDLEEYDAIAFQHEEGLGPLFFPCLYSASKIEGLEMFNFSIFTITVQFIVVKVGCVISLLCSYARDS
jgi:hypothetical protein